jgi:hypothetical protein
VTVEELRKAESRFKRAYERMEHAREARNEAIRAALAEGWTHQRISEATGLTRGRINQIANP